MSYSKTIKFSSPPKAIKVNQIALPPIPVEQSNEYALSEYERGKKEATEFYQQEIQKLRDNYAKEQSTLLSSIDNKKPRNVFRRDRYGQLRDMLEF